MKMPRDVNGEDLARRLSKFGYAVTRQTGSHIRLTTMKEGEHHITIPKHSPLKIGTLNSILKEISLHFKSDKSDILQKLW